MNIFAYHPDPEICATWLDDTRKSKMIVETCQLLSTAMNCLEPNHGYHVYKSFNPAHGSNIWARASYENYQWLVEYVYLLDEQRGLNDDGTAHKCRASGIMMQCKSFLYSNRHSFPSKSLTPFSNNAANDKLGISFKHLACTHTAYRMYHLARWPLDNPAPTWQHGERPDWYG